MQGLALQPLGHLTSYRDLLSAEKQNDGVHNIHDTNYRNLPEIISGITGTNTHLSVQIEAYQYAHYLNRLRRPSSSSTANNTLFGDVSLNTEIDKMKALCSAAGVNVPFNTIDDLSNAINILTGMLINGFPNSIGNGKYDLIQQLSDFAELEAFVDNAKAIHLESAILTYISQIQKLRESFLV